jgi:hypothetical protein
MQECHVTYRLQCLETSLVAIRNLQAGDDALTLICHITTVVEYDAVSSATALHVNGMLSLERHMQCFDVTAKHFQDRDMEKI